MQSFYFRDTDLMVHHSIDRVPSPSDFQMHAHDMFELYYFISGKGSYIVEGTEYELCPGDILLMRPSEAHKLNICSDEPYERIAVHFLPSVFNGMIDDSQLLRPFLQRPLGQFNQYRKSDYNDSILEQHLQLLTDDTVRGDELRMHTVAYMLPTVYELARCYDKRIELKDYVKNSSTANDIIGYVNNHIYEQINLENIAERFFLSKSQINRIFKASTGSAVWEYVMIKRLLSSRLRIKSGENAGEVAKQCGFNDYSSFYRAYKKQFGVSPTADAAKG